MTSFQRVTATLGDYLWSTAANWSAGLPVDHGTAIVNIGYPGNPGGIDDIASLDLDTLALAQGYIAVTGTLEVGELASSGGSGVTLYSSTIPGNASAKLLVDGYSGTNIFVGAVGFGALTVVRAPTDPGETYYVDEGGELVLSAAPSGSSSFSFGDAPTPAGPPAGTLAFRNPGGTVASEVIGVAVGDSIALPGSYVAHVQFGANSLAVTTDLGITAFSNVSYSGTMPNAYAVSADPNGLERITFVCFVEGTRISTEAGATAVEALRVGDRVLTQSGGSRPIRWIGHRHLDLTRHAAPDRARPIRISAGAFAEDVPNRDLFLSPDHAVFWDDVLIPARLLVNGASIAIDTACQTVTYYHVELDAHDIVLAGNLPSESYLDTGNRAWFQNSGVPVLLHPDLTVSQARREAESCAPFSVDPGRVEPIWRDLIERAIKLGRRPPPEPSTTDDPDLCLLVAGQYVAPACVVGGCYTFLLPNGNAAVRLVSRSAPLSLTRPWLSDDRRLGVQLSGVTVRRGASVSEIPLDHPSFGDGWWQPEWHSPTALRRWTNGDALVPLPGIELTEPGPLLLEIEIAGTVAYPACGAAGPRPNQVAHGRKLMAF